jgi:hypothetical protein
MQKCLTLSRNSSDRARNGPQRARPTSGLCASGVLEGGGFGPTVGVADGDCRSGGRLPGRWVGRQPSFDPARAAVHSAQRSEVRGSDSWRVLAIPKSAHRFGSDVRSLRVIRTCAQQRKQRQNVSTARTIPGQRGRTESRGSGGDRLARRPPLLISVGPPDGPCCTTRTDCEEIGAAAHPQQPVFQGSATQRERSSLAKKLQLHRSV